jgi:hypothetical protein
VSGEPEQMPPDPVSDRQAGAMAMHHIFLTLRSGGFTVEEAGAVIASFIRGGKGADDES